MVQLILPIVSHSYLTNKYFIILGTDSGGGTFPGGPMRICPSGQTQPQQDPKQQPQTQSMQGKKLFF